VTREERLSMRTRCVDFLRQEMVSRTKEDQREVALAVESIAESFRSDLDKELTFERERLREPAVQRFRR
jgi:hypothetical protein